MERWGCSAAATEPESPLCPSLQLPQVYWWSQLKDVKLFSVHVSAMALFQSWPLSKNHPSTWRCCTSLFLLAILHQLSNSTCPVWDVVTRLAAFMLETHILELVFSKPVWPKRDWGEKRHLSALESATRTVALFSPTWQKLLLMPASCALTATGHYELTHASRCPVCKAVYFS